MEIDIERLRQDLLNYFGTASSFFPVAYMDVCKIQTASYEELLNIAIQNGFDLNNYVVNKRK